MGVNGSLTADVFNPRFTIVSKSDPHVGDEVEKMGATTGWTHGRVSWTCVSSSVQDPDPQITNSDLVLACQSGARYYSNLGDSGSPLFGWSADLRVPFHGISFAVFTGTWPDGSHRSAFSPVSGIEKDIAPLNFGDPVEWPRPYRLSNQLAYLQFSEKCIDVPSGTRTPQVQLWDCLINDPQSFRLIDDGTMVIYGGSETLCLDDGGGQAQNGDPIIIWHCNKLPPQRWDYDPNTAEIKLRGTNLCIDVPGWNQANNSDRLILWTCNGDPDQRWLRIPNP
jgi:hypothetical protein